MWNRLDEVNGLVKLVSRCKLFLWTSVLEHPSLSSFTDLEFIGRGKCTGEVGFLLIIFPAVLQLILVGTGAGPAQLIKLFLFAIFSMQ